MPSDILMANIMGRIHPASLMRLGLTCTTFHGLCLQTMHRVHGYLDGSHEHFDAEHLFAIYNGVDVPLGELPQLKTLILKAIPPPTNGYESPEFKIYKNALFEDHPITCYEITISSKYKELCRIVLKYKSFKNFNGTGIKKAKWLSQALKGPGAGNAPLSQYSWSFFAREAEPEASFMQAELILKKSSAMNTIFSGDPIHHLFDLGLTLHIDDLYLLCIYVRDQDIPRVKPILYANYTSAFESFLPVLLTYRYNWVFDAIAPRMRLSEVNRRKLIYILSSSYAPYPVYCALRGRMRVLRRFEFLQSFDPIRKIFAHTGYPWKSLPMLLETALLFFRDEDLIETLLQSYPMPVFFHHIFLACTTPISDRLSYILLCHLAGDHLDISDLCPVAGSSSLFCPRLLKFHVPPLFLEHFIPYNLREKTCELSEMKLEMLFHNLVKSDHLEFDLISPVLMKLRETEREYLVTIFVTALARTKDVPREARKIVQFCLQHKILFRISPEKYHEIFLGAFNLPTAVLLDYLQSKDGAESAWHNTQYYCSSFYAAGNILLRPGGVEILRTYFASDHTKFYRIVALFHLEAVPLPDFVLAMGSFGNLELWLSEMTDYLVDRFDAFIQLVLYEAKRHVQKIPHLIFIGLEASSSQLAREYLSTLDKDQLHLLLLKCPQIAYRISLSRGLCSHVKNLELSDLFVATLLTTNRDQVLVTHRILVHLMHYFNVSKVDIENMDT